MFICSCQIQEANSYAVNLFIDYINIDGYTYFSFQENQLLSQAL